MMAADVALADRHRLISSWTQDTAGNFQDYAASGAIEVSSGARAFRRGSVTPCVALAVSMRPSSVYRTDQSHNVQLFYFNDYYHTSACTRLQGGAGRLLGRPGPPSSRGRSDRNVSDLLPSAMGTAGSVTRLLAPLRVRAEGPWPVAVLADAGWCRGQFARA